MKNRFNLLVALLLTSTVTCRAVDYERAKALQKKMRDGVVNETLHTVWSEDGTSLFYRWKQPDGSSGIFRTDTGTGKTQPAFDPARLARAFGSTFQPLEIKIENFIAKSDEVFICLARAGKTIRILSVTKSGIKETEAAENPFALNPRRRSKGLKSPKSSQRSKIFFINNTVNPVKLEWIDLSGKPKLYATVQPDATYTMATFTGHIFLAGDVVFTAQDKPMVAYLADTPKKAQKTPVAKKRPKREWLAMFEGNNLHVKNLKTGKQTQLTENGSADWKYCGPMQWSPNGRYLVVMREKRGTNREIDLIEAAPKDRLQPKRITIRYLKPGDDLPVKKPCLFDLQTLEKIPLDDALFSNPWNITQLHWTPKSDRFFFIYNERGHQTLRLLAAQSATGKVRTVTEERSKTFIDYSQKTCLHHLDATDEAIWMSERDGWNHLYLIDRKNGRVKNQITKGQWVVRGVDRVDEEKRQVWFRACGIRPGQDPYYIHYARINFDGSGLIVLTEANGSHEIQLSPDRRFFTDRWSRTDQPPVHELRRATDGSLVCQLGKADASRLLKVHPHLPEPFAAKGRDGKTDIYGVIFRPSDFDPENNYPVIESIYAGPHGQHVPKTFASFRGQQRMAELGFIVVQIDGMGTNWRSKAFHDVCWKNLKDAGFPDRIAWMKAAARKYPYMDLSRVGIYGGSAGGQNAMRALLDHGDFYKAAAADCGCHDNRMDKIWWNEAWMGWPVDESYEKSSNVVDAHKLQGKLLLTVGALDSNVDPSSTMQVVDALIQADKDFELIVFPSKGHGAGESPYGVRRREEFFVRHLLENTAGL